MSSCQIKDEEMPTQGTQGYSKARWGSYLMAYYARRKGELKQYRIFKKSRSSSGKTFIFFLIVLCMILFWPSKSFRTGKEDKLQTRRPRFEKLPHIMSQRTTESVPLNSTLGFSKIFAINLEHRVDKREELLLVSYMSGLDVSIVPATTVDATRAQVLPPKGVIEPETQLAALRSHLGLWARIVYERMPSALILEDDVDWDVNVKEIFARVQEPWATLIGSIKEDGRHRGPTLESPWPDPDDWDLMYFGQCLDIPFRAKTYPEEKFPDLEGLKLSGSKIIDLNNPPYVVYKDADSPNINQTTQWVGEVFKTYSIGPSDDPDEKVRIVSRAAGPVCVASYAVSLRGAARMLFAFNRRYGSNLDIGMKELAKYGKIEAYSMTPPLMGQWKVVNGGKSNSDNHGRITNSFRGRMDVGSAKNVYHSARQHMKMFFTSS